MSVSGSQTFNPLRQQVSLLVSPFPWGGVREDGLEISRPQDSFHQPGDHRADLEPHSDH